jgi:hypothetical protein
LRIYSHFDFHLFRSDSEGVISETSELLKTAFQSYARYFESEPAKVANFLDVRLQKQNSYLPVSAEEIGPNSKILLLRNGNRLAR